MNANEFAIERNDEIIAHVIDTFFDQRANVHFCNDYRDMIVHHACACVEHDRIVEFDVDAYDVDDYSMNARARAMSYAIVLYDDIMHTIASFHVNCIIVDDVDVDVAIDMMRARARM